MPNKKTSSHHKSAALKLVRAKVHDAHASVAAPNSEFSHKAYYNKLVNSGATSEQIERAWHAYYQGLTVEEQNNVWQEYYDEQGIVSPSHTARMKLDAGEIAGAIHHDTEQPQSVAEAKKTINQRVAQRANMVRKNKHVRAISFAICTGAVVLILNFNELAAAQFKAYLSPGSQSATPVIIGGGADQPVGPEARIIIPKLNIDVPVVYDESSVDERKVQSALERGVVHYANTPVPGDPGNDVIVGHSSNNLFNSGKYKFAFVLLSKLDSNDTFVLNYNSKRYIYRVYEKKIVRPNDVSVLGAAPQSHTVTLITCDPPGTAVNRLIIRAQQISPEPGTAPTPATTTASVPTQVPGNAPSLFQRFRDWLLH